MNRSQFLRLVSLGSLVSLSSGPAWAAAEDEIDINAKGKAAIPISLSGYSGEVLSVLRFDLEVAGFNVVAPESAKFNVSGNNSSAVEGQLVEAATRNVLLQNRRYTGGSLRIQAHTFSDEIVLKVTGKPGIARTKIAFRGDESGGSEIYVADYDGANAIAVTRDRALVKAPCWVPNRRMLLYTSYKSGFPDIYSHNLETGERHTVAKYPGSNSNAAVSPDGRRVAFISSQAGSPDLYVCDLDGSNLKQLTKTREDEYSPCWSPDGRTICFGSRIGGTPALYTISPEGAGQKRLTVRGGGSSVTEPDWSPDGKYILYTVVRRAGFELGMVPATGGDAEPLAAGSDGCWAPNSRTVVFTRHNKGRATLSLLDVQTKQVKDVAQNAGSWSQPCWAK